MHTQQGRARGQRHANSSTGSSSELYVTAALQWSFKQTPMTTANSQSRAAVQLQSTYSTHVIPTPHHPRFLALLLCRAARDWGTCRLVRLSWLEESLQLGYAAAEEAHLLT